MSTSDLDLTVARIIKAPRAKVWRAWADPRRFEQWWVPAPGACKVTAMELAPGGAFETLYREPGDDFGPHMSGCFLEVIEGERIVFTTALVAGWRPAEDPFISLSAIITFRDHAQGTDYSATALHASPASAAKHVELGFHEGWGAVTAQLAALAEAD